MAESSSSSTSIYDVFINNCGPDVQKTFACYLYRLFLSYGLKVFLDPEDLKRGDSNNSQMEGVIRTASFHVAIFSSEYAGSTWCLKDLLLMKYDPQTPQEIPRHDSATVGQWRNALSIVAGESGFELEDCNSDEGILPNKEVESVLSNVKKPLDVAKYPTGLDENVTI